MKKIFVLSLSVIMIFCCGCTKLESGISSYYSESDISSLYTASDSVDDIVSRLDSYLSEQQDTGAISVTESTYSYYEDESSLQLQSDEAQTVIIDDSLVKEDIIEGALAQVVEDGEKPLYFSVLNDEQKRIYRIIKFMAEDMVTDARSLGATNDSATRINDISIAFKALVSDSPEIFWMPYVYGISKDGTVFSFGDKFAYSKTEVQAMKTELNEVIGSIKSATKNLSRFEKELYIHDYLCENISYNTSPTTSSFTSYGALIEGQAVCEGYSKAMQLLCDNTGVPCTVFYGTSKGVGHMWNIVNPGDSWYHLDVTWDDIDENIYCHSYFNLTESQITLDHEIAPIADNKTDLATLELFNLSAFNCNSTGYNYYQMKNQIFGEDYKAVASIVVTKSSHGERNVELLYQNSLAVADAVQKVQEIITNSGYSEVINEYTVMGSAIILHW